jgi:hypothetical protein
MKYLIYPILAVTLILSGCQKQDGEMPEPEEVDMLKEQLAQFAPTELKYDSSILDERQKKVVEKLYYASKIMDEIFLDQVYAKNYEIKKELIKEASEGSEVAKLQLQLFDIMFGPFDRLDHDAPFIGTEKKPLGANFYPENMTKEEFENWIKDNPEDEKSFTSEFTVIRRDGDKLIAIPYNKFWKDKLTEAARILKEAAEYADNPTLKK